MAIWCPGIKQLAQWYFYYTSAKTLRMISVPQEAEFTHKQKLNYISTGGTD